MLSCVTGDWRCVPWARCIRQRQDFSWGAHCQGQEGEVMGDGEGDVPAAREVLLLFEVL